MIQTQVISPPWQPEGPPDRCRNFAADWRDADRWARRVACGPTDAPRVRSGSDGGVELRMWQAYYAKERVVFALLVTMLHDRTTTRGQQRRERASILHVPQRDRRHAGELRERPAGPWSAWYASHGMVDAEFDPGAVAQAELAWWVGRRTPNQDSPEQVGGLIADTWALLYDVPRGQVQWPPSGGHKRRIPRR